MAVGDLHLCFQSASRGTKQHECKPFKKLLKSFNLGFNLLTPGSLARAHPSPWLTIPVKYHSVGLLMLLQTSGPAIKFFKLF